MLRRAFVVMLAVAALVGPALPASAADRPNTRTGATTPSAQTAWLADTIGSATDQDWYRFDLAASRHVLVTLGSLPADYVLKLYNSSGTLVTYSSRSGVVYEEIYRALPAGRYFVQVTSKAGAYNATKPYALMFRPLADSVFVLSSRARVADGYLSIAGEVLNNTSTKRDFVEVAVTIYNSSNQVIAHNFTYAYNEIVNPRARSPFMIFMSAPAGFHHYRFVVSGDVTTDARVAGLQVLPGVPSATDYGYRFYPGQVKNTNAFGVRYVMVLGTFYDSRGRVLNTDFTFTSPSDIPAGATRGYELMVAVDEIAGVQRIVWGYDAMR